MVWGVAVVDACKYRGCCCECELDIVYGCCCCCCCCRCCCCCCCRCCCCCPISCCCCSCCCCCAAERERDRESLAEGENDIDGATDGALVIATSHNTPPCPALSLSATSTLLIPTPVVRSTAFLIAIFEDSNSVTPTPESFPSKTARKLNIMHTAVALGSVGRELGMMVGGFSGWYVGLRGVFVVE